MVDLAQNKSYVKKDKAGEYDRKPAASFIGNIMTECLEVTFYFSLGLWSEVFRLLEYLKNNIYVAHFYSIGNFYLVIYHHHKAKSMYTKVIILLTFENEAQKSTY